MEIDADEAFAVFTPREGVDKVWRGDGVIYSQRLSAERTKSRLGRIVGTAPYKSMTIRSWTTPIGRRPFFRCSQGWPPGRPRLAA